MYTDKIEGKVIVIGDIHGELKKTMRLIDWIIKNKYHENRWVVFLGDYIDRGPDSAGVIEFLLNFHKHHPQTTFCCGNHDLNLTKALNLVENPHQKFYWNRIPERNAATMKSYHASNGLELYNKMPNEHKEFLVNLPWCVEHPDFLFVHSGIDPFEPYEKQIIEMKARDFKTYKPKWLYDESLAFYSPENTEKTVVSGHTIIQEPVMRKQRLLIDTGAGYGGKLTALFLPEYQIAQA